MTEGRFRSDLCACSSNASETRELHHDESCPFFDRQAHLDQIFGPRPRFDASRPGNFSGIEEIASNIGFGKFVPVLTPLVPTKARRALGVVFAGLVEDSLRYDLDLESCVRTVSLSRTENFLIRCVDRRVMSFVSFNLTPIFARRFLVSNVCEKTLRLASPEERRAQDLADEIFEFAIAEFDYMFEFDCE